MVTVPKRLLSDARVSILFKSEDVVVLHKVIAEPMFERPSYLTMHAISLVGQGTQVIQTENQSSMRIDAGKAGIMQRGLYTISDLLATEDGNFSTTVIFFSDALVRTLLGRKPVDGDNAINDLRLKRSDAPVLPLCWSKTAIIKLLKELPIDLSSLLRVQRGPLRDFMKAHFDKPLAVADYAYLTGRSERSFRRDFKARFGESPKRWLIKKRLERSRELLRSQEVRSVQEAAMSVGYVSVSHFIELYSSHFGVTPGVESL